MRSIGRAEEVVTDILRQPQLFDEVFEGMFDADPVIRMRAADVIEKVSQKHPEYLQPFKKRLISEVSKIEQQEVRWHTAQMLSYLSINRTERDRIVQILISYLDNEKSKIVKVNAMQTLADLAERDRSLKPRVLKILERAAGTDSPALVSRGKKLIK
ncbi:MAG: hypothetical protein JRG97_09280, partial [Deltaproteobacteria bacterium]|nr:hypothetical protein [Deltaproteobacteria bacterium]